MIRQTRQRSAILRALQDAGRPLAPPELHELASAHYPALGLRTVYRQIRELVAAGTLVGVDYPGQPLRYELYSGQHQAHFICRTCRRLYALEHEVPDVPVPAAPGFTIEGQETIFYGTCPTCAG